MNVKTLLAERMPQMVYCTDEFSNGTRNRHKSNTKEYKYIQLQIKDKLVNALIFDLDYLGAAFAWQDANLPQPTVVTINPKNGHAHYIYLLLAPVATSEKARTAPKTYLKSIEQAYKLKLGADSNYAGLLTKNPFNNTWRTIWHDRTYDLAELAEYADLASLSYKWSVNQDVDSGRNCFVFNEIRQLAYSLVNQCSSESQFSSLVFSETDSFNSKLPSPLPASEVKTISNSITKYTWKNRYIVGKNGISQISRNKIEAAIMTLKLTLSDAWARVGFSDEFLLKHNKKELASISGLGLTTIKRYENREF